MGGLINSFGAVGPKGDKGDKGDKGNTGSTGATGATGIGYKSYTTSEQDTGLTWINGKKIYQKTINFGKAPNNTTKNVAHNISNLDMVIRLSTVISVNDQQLMLDSSWTNLNSFAYVNRNGSNITMTTNMDISNQDVYVTLWYTKKS